MKFVDGVRAPNFILADQDGNDFVLDEWRGGWTLLFFYPADFSVVCTKEACELRDAMGEFARRGVKVVGVSFQKPESHRRFRERHSLPFPLLWDRQKRIAKRYKVKGLFGFFARRAYFIIDPRGWIVWQHVEALPFFKRSLDELLQALDRCKEIDFEKFPEKTESMQ